MMIQIGKRWPVRWANSADAWDNQNQHARSGLHQVTAATRRYQRVDASRVDHRKFEIAIERNTQMKFDTP
jgi:hypothetical protein